MDKTYAEALDFLLARINELEAHQTNIALGINWQKIDKVLETEYKLDVREVNAILKKLEKDEMIFLDDRGFNHRVTFKGKDFLKEGGYTKLRQNAIDDRQYRL